MKSLYLTAVVLSSALLAPKAIAVTYDQGASANADKPINTLCPVSKEPIVPAAGTIELKGNAIGVCCPGCGRAFMAWDESRQDEFISMAMLGETPGNSAHALQSKPASPSAETVPYILNTCIVTGGKLGSMGDPVVKTYDGREVKFCCAGCIGKFESDKATYIKRTDELMAKDQRRYYPTDKCVISGDSLVEDGEDIAVEFVYQNRLIRTCCKMCIKDFKGDPEKYLEKLDKLTADAQRPKYPLDTCAVLGSSKLGSMGEPSEMIVAGRLLRFCCAGCEPKVKAEPAKYLAAIDKAWQAKGKYMPEKDK